MTATIDEFMASLAKNGERSGYSSQNPGNGAYGKYQILPYNWRNWAPLALGTDPLLAVAALDILPAQWVPVIEGDLPEGRANQDATARWKIAIYAAKVNNDWQRVAGKWQSGSFNPADWGSRTVKYVNRVCVPLGYAAL